MKKAIKENSLTVRETSEYIRDHTCIQLSKNQIRRIFHDEIRMLRNRG